MIKILIHTHGEFGKEMLDSAEVIIGKQEEVYIVSLKPGDSLASVCGNVGKLFKDIKGEDGVLVLADIMGGTPCNSCLTLSNDYKMEIVTGLNLYMLISAFMNRNSMDIKQLAEKVIEDGRKNIANPKDVLIKKMK